MSQDPSQEGIGLRVITPEKVIIDEKDVEIVVIKYQEASDEGEGGDKGEIGIMRNHAPMLVRVPISPVKYIKGDNTHYLAVADGFVEVRNNVVSILTTGAEKITVKGDMSPAMAAKLRVEEWLTQRGVGKVSFDEKKAEAEVKKEAVHLYQGQTKN